MWVCVCVCVGGGGVCECVEGRRRSHGGQWVRGGGGGRGDGVCDCVEGKRKGRSEGEQ